MGSELGKAGEMVAGVKDKHRKITGGELGILGIDGEEGGQRI